MACRGFRFVAAAGLASESEILLAGLLGSSIKLAVQKMQWAFGHITFVDSIRSDLCNVAHSGPSIQEAVELECVPAGFYRR